MFFSFKFNTDSLVISICYNICMLISFRKLTNWERRGNFKISNKGYESIKRTLESHVFTSSKCSHPIEYLVHDDTEAVYITLLRTTGMRTWTRQQLGGCP